MTTIADISSLKEMRSITFADLFYEVLESTDGRGITRGIIAAIDPGFVPALAKRREETLALLVIKDALSSARNKHLREVQEKEEEEARKQAEREMQEKLYGALGYGASSLFRDIQRLEELQELQDSLRGGSSTANSAQNRAKRKVRTLGFDELLNVLKNEVIDETPECITALAEEDDLCSEFLAVLEERISQQGNASPNKALKGLYMLPELNDDQELIIFFGNNFHATFANVDAYTGLLYASEYFDYDGYYLNSVILSATKEEREAVIRNERNARDYAEAQRALGNGEYDEAIQLFDKLGSYKNSAAMLQKAYGAHREAARAEVYRQASQLLEEGKFDEAEKSFTELEDYKDSPHKLEEIERLREDAAKEVIYKEAILKMEDAKYIEAEELFLSLGEFRFAPKMAKQAGEKKNEWLYKKAMKHRKKGEFDAAIRTFKKLGDYKDSKDQVEKTKQEKEEDRIWKEREEELRMIGLYEEGKKYLADEEFEKAAQLFTDLADFQDAQSLLAQTRETAEKEAAYKEAEALFARNAYTSAEKAYKALGDYKDCQWKAECAKKANEERKEQQYQNARTYLKVGEYKRAESGFKKLGKYLDSAELMEQAAVLASAKDRFESADYAGVKRNLRMPVLAESTIAKKMLEDVEKIERLIESTKQLKKELQATEAEHAKVEKRLAELIEVSRVPVASQIALNESIARHKALQEKLSGLGVFALKEKRNVQAQMSEEAALQDRCRRQIPAEENEKQAAIEQEKRLLDGRKQQLSSKIESLRAQIIKNNTKLTLLKGSAGKADVTVV